MHRRLSIFFAALAVTFAGPALAQGPLDRARPLIASPDLVAPPATPRSTTSVPVETPERADVMASPVAGVLVGSIRVEGAQSLRPSDFAPAITPWLGRVLSADELRAVATAVADVARGRGYIFARASIPRQSLATGMLIVRVDEGRIDQVQIEGGDHAQLEHILGVLADGQPVTRAVLEDALFTAGDVPGITVGAARLRREAGRNILIVPITYDRISGRALLDNRGTNLIGPVRAQLGLDLNGLVLRHDTLSIGGAITPAQPREFRLASARYGVQLGHSGLGIGISGYYAKSAASGAFRELGITGENYEIALDARQPLLRARKASIWATGGFALRRGRLDAENSLALRTDRVSALLFGLDGYGVVGGGVLRATVSTSIGLGLFDATRRGDDLSSRPNGSGRFVAWNGDFSWARPLGKKFTLRATGETQFATRPLLVSEQFSLGGARLLRGYDYGERLGDEGAAGSLELSFRLPKTPRPVKRAELYAFVDGGKVSDKDGSYRSSLASAGGGVRMSIGPFTAAAEIAAPLTGPRYDSGDRSPRISFTLAALF